jgi:hypothetical protein
MILSNVLDSFSIYQQQFISKFPDSISSFLNAEMINRIKTTVKTSFFHLTQSINNNNNNSLKGIAMLGCCTLMLLLFLSVFRRQDAPRLVTPPTPQLPGDPQRDLPRRPRPRSSSSPAIF